MTGRLIRRSTALAVATTLLFSTAALADTVAADGDFVTIGDQNLVDLGTVAPGATINRDVTFTLVCAGLRHADPGQIVTVSPISVTVPLAGGSASATDGTIGPVPDTWVSDAAGIVGCPSDLRLAGATPSRVTIVAPITAGQDYAFTVLYGKSLAPAGVADSSSVSGGTAVTFSLDVGDADTRAPTLGGVPADMDIVTADPAGVTLDYPMPTATDDRDPAPVVACDPPPGAAIPVGITTVTCTATDAAGNQATASFRVTVHLGTVEWQDPIRGSAVLATRGRSLPIKARAWLDGEALTGPARLEVSGCETPTPEAIRTLEAPWQPDAGRWMAVLDTTGLAIGCHVVTLVGGGATLGSFTLMVLEPSAAGTSPGGGSNRPA